MFGRIRVSIAGEWKRQSMKRNVRALGRVAVTTTVTEWRVFRDRRMSAGRIAGPMHLVALAPLQPGQLPHLRSSIRAREGE